MNVSHLYENLRTDQRLQQDWERHQSRIDRCIEAPLIVQTSREVATAALLWLKLVFEPKAAIINAPATPSNLLEWARAGRHDVCKGGPRLVNLLSTGYPSPEEAHAATASLFFYKDRTAPNGLMSCAWSEHGLKALAHAGVDDVLAKNLRVTGGQRAAGGVIDVAQLLVDPPDVLSRPLGLRGVGDERGDAIGVFGFRQSWPITDENLWALCESHGVLSPTDITKKSYKARRRVFEPHWRALLEAYLEIPPDELAATLYLWANEAVRYGFRYA